MEPVLSLIRPLAFAAIFVSLAAAAGLAQDNVAAGDPVTDTTASALSVVERWRSDPAIVFDASEINLNELVYLARPVVVFADSPQDPRFIEQMNLLLARSAELASRNVILVTDTAPDARSQLRQDLRPHGFGLVLIDTDGQVALRKPEPWDVRELTRAIDKMPSRLRELGR